MYVIKYILLHATVLKQLYIYYTVGIDHINVKVVCVDHQDFFVFLDWFQLSLRPKTIENKWIYKGINWFKICADVNKSVQKLQ